MRQTSKTILKQISKLKEAAKKLQREERQGVLHQVIEAINVYDFTTEELGFQGGMRPKQKPAAPSTARLFSDGKGNTWGGRGPRPKWLADQLGAGRTLDEFRVQPGSVVGRPAAAKSAAGKSAAAKKVTAKRAPVSARRPAAKKTKQVNKAKFSDGQGNTWTGLGPKPRWFKDALAAGRKEADLRV